MTMEFSCPLVYRLVELVCMLGTLIVTSIVSYLKPLPGDMTRAFSRFLFAVVFGYIFVLTADVASRFLGGGVAAIAVSSGPKRRTTTPHFNIFVIFRSSVVAVKMFAFTVVGFALFTATAATLAYSYYRVALMMPLFAIIALDSLLLVIDAVLTYARVKRTSLVTAPKLNLR